MARTVVALVVGTLLGVAVTLLLTSRHDVPALDDSPLTVFSAAPAFPVATPAAQEASRDFYRRLADADASELADMIAQAAAEPPSTDRELALAVLLKRYAEIDVVRAVRLARAAQVRGTALGTVYGAWARAAPGQALTALSTIESPDDAVDVALALIATLGSDARAVERVATVLAERAEDETAGTVRASPIPPPADLVPARSALALVAARWAELGPRRALTISREIGSERVRLAFEAAALRALARVAPDEVFAEIGALGTGAARLPALMATLIDLAREHPEQLLRAVGELPADARRIAESVAMQQLAERDPLAAMRHLEGGVPSGMQREALLQIIARSYGKRDAAAALAWARAQPGRQNLVAAVIGGVAEQDAGRALDLALELTSPIERMQAVQFAAMAGARTNEAAESIANRLLTLEDPALRESLAFGVITTWAAREPDSAMRWLLANAQSAPPNLFQNMGQQLAMRDPRSATAYSTQIPAAARESWILGIAQGYAQNDSQGAIDWLRQFRGEPWYESAATSIVMNMAHTDGAAAARLVDELDTERMGLQGQQLANVVAGNWANRDPAAAAEWALDRGADAERAMAVQNVVSVWSNLDLSAARQWTLRLPRGELRDGALTTLLPASAFNDGGTGLDAGLLNAFASETSRQQAVVQIVQSLAYSDPTRARSVADLYLSDPVFRAQVERIIEAAGQTGAAPRLGAAQGVRLVRPPRQLQGTN